MNKLKKVMVYVCTVATVFGATTAVYAGASKTLNGGGAKWTGGETSDGILYSNLYDEKEDGIKYNVTAVSYTHLIWCAFNLYIKS